MSTYSPQLGGPAWLESLPVVAILGSQPREAPAPVSMPMLGQPARQVAAGAVDGATAQSTVVAFPGLLPHVVPGASATVSVAAHALTLGFVLIPGGTATVGVQGWVAAWVPTATVATAAFVPTRRGVIHWPTASVSAAALITPGLVYRWQAPTASVSVRGWSAVWVPTATVGVSAVAPIVKKGMRWPTATATVAAGVPARQGRSHATPGGVNVTANAATLVHRQPGATATMAVAAPVARRCARFAAPSARVLPRANPPWPYRTPTRFSATGEPVPPEGVEWGSPLGPLLPFGGHWSDWQAGDVIQLDSDAQDVIRDIPLRPDRPDGVALTGTRLWGYFYRDQQIDRDEDAAEKAEGLSVLRSFWAEAAATTAHYTSFDDAKYVESGYGNVVPNWTHPNVGNAHIPGSLGDESMWGRAVGYSVTDRWVYRTHYADEPDHVYLESNSRVRNCAFLFPWEPDPFRFDGAGVEWESTNVIQSNVRLKVDVRVPEAPRKWDTNTYRDCLSDQATFTLDVFVARQQTTPTMRGFTDAPFVGPGDMFTAMSADAAFGRELGATLVGSIVCDWVGDETRSFSFPLPFTDFSPDSPAPLVFVRHRDAEAGHFVTPPLRDEITDWVQFSEVYQVGYVHCRLVNEYVLPRYRVYVVSPGSEASGPLPNPPGGDDPQPDPAKPPTIVVNNPHGDEVSRGTLPPGAPANAFVTLRFHSDWLMVLYNGKIICMYHLTPAEYATLVSGGWRLWFVSSSGTRAEIPLGASTPQPVEGWLYRVDSAQTDPGLGFDPLLRRGRYAWGRDVWVTPTGEVGAGECPVDSVVNAPGNRVYLGGRQWRISFDEALAIWAAGHGDVLRAEAVGDPPALTLGP